MQFLKRFEKSKEGRREIVARNRINREKEEENEKEVEKETEKEERKNRRDCKFKRGVQEKNQNLKKKDERLEEVFSFENVFVVKRVNFERRERKN